MYFAKRLIEALLSPLGWIVWLFLVGLLLAALRKPTSARRFLMAGAGLFLFGYFSPAAELAIWGLEQDYSPLQHPEKLGNVDTVVVLAGYGERHASIPITSNLSDETIARIVEGVRIYRALPGGKILFSGGTPTGLVPPAAELMAEFAQAQGVERDDILTEIRSRDTHENLVEVRKILGVRRFVLVTSAYHLRRTLAVAQKLDMNPIPAPAYIQTLQNFPATLSGFQLWSKVARSFLSPSVFRLFFLQQAFHEYAGYWWYRWSGRI
ncbi:MAG: ElyC/SanA/YdcF family protein [Acidobacteriota bacterium]